MLLPGQSPITFSFVHLSLSLALTRGCCMGFKKDHPLNKGRGCVLTCPCKNMITEVGNESEIGSNTVKIIIIIIIIIKVMYSGNNLQVSKLLLTFKRYIRFKTLLCKFVFC